MRRIATLPIIAVLAMFGLSFATPSTVFAAEPEPVVIVDDTAPALPIEATDSIEDAATSAPSGIDLSNAIDGAVQGFQNAPEGAPWWMYLIYVVLGIVMAVFGSGYLGLKAAELREKAKNVQGDLKKKAWLSLQAYALERADARLQKDGWAIAKRVADGELSDAASIKTLLRQLGQEEKTELVEYFRDNFPELGGNLFETFGEKYVDQLIEWAANKVWSQIPEFAGKDTAETMLNGGAKKLLNYGITHALDYGMGKLEGVLTPTPTDPLTDG